MSRGARLLLRAELSYPGGSEVTHTLELDAHVVIDFDRLTHLPEIQS